MSPARMPFMDAMEIVLAMAEDAALDENDPEVKGSPALLEAAQAQKEALTRIRLFHNEAAAAAKAALSSMSKQ